jgi:hypothetical protein
VTWICPRRAASDREKDTPRRPENRDIDAVLQLMFSLIAGLQCRRIRTFRASAPEFSRPNVLFIL